MPSIRVGDYRFLTTWKIIAMGMLSVSLLLALGVWQLHRGAEKKQLLQAYTKQSQALPIVWDPTHAAPAPYQRLKLQGYYLATQFLLDNQFYQHQWGYHVLSPFCLEKGGQIIFIDRGWIKGDVTRQHLPTIKTEKHRQEVLGYAFYPQKNRWIKQAPLPVSSATVIVIEQFLPDIFKSVLQYPVLPFMMRLEKTIPTHLKQEWQVVSVSPARHLAYAIQWFALAFFFVVVFVAVQLKREST